MHRSLQADYYYHIYTLSRELSTSLLCMQDETSPTIDITLQLQLSLRQAISYMQRAKLLEEDEMSLSEGLEIIYIPTKSS